MSLNGTLPRSKLPRTNSYPASSYMEALAELHIHNSIHQKDDLISADDFRRRLTARKVLWRLALGEMVTFGISCSSELRRIRWNMLVKDWWEVLNEWKPHRKPKPIQYYVVFTKNSAPGGEGFDQTLGRYDSVSLKINDALCWQNTCTAFLKQWNPTIALMWNADLRWYA